MQKQQAIEKELQDLIKEIEVEEDNNRKRRLKGAKKALEWVLGQERWGPHDL
jgi:hypothetical protein